jgi:ATP-dependent Clp protease ATP-binding subunit ClpA
MFERFTRPSRAAVMRARDESRQLKHGHIGTEHILLALLDPEPPDEGVDDIASRVLREAGVTPAHVRAEIERLVASGPVRLSDEDAEALRSVGIDLKAVLARIEENFGPDAVLAPPPAPRRGLLRRRKPYPGGSRFTPRSKKVLELSLREALRLNTNYIGTEHILLGLIREGQGLGAKILADSGVDLDELRTATERALRRAA